MADISLTHMSSKGQVVIPRELRHGFNAGEKLVVIRNNGQLILKRAADFEKNLAEDLAFAKRTEEAWKRYEKGEFVGPLSAEQFEKRVKSWSI